MNHAPYFVQIATHCCSARRAQVCAVTLKLYVPYFVSGRDTVVSAERAQLYSAPLELCVPSPFRPPRTAVCSARHAHIYVVPPLVLVQLTLFPSRDLLMIIAAAAPSSEGTSGKILECAVRKCEGLLSFENCLQTLSVWWKRLALVAFEPSEHIHWVRVMLQ